MVRVGNSQIGTSRDSVWGIFAALAELLWGWLGAPRVRGSRGGRSRSATIPSPFGFAQEESADFGWHG